MLDLGQITTTLTASASGFLNAFAQAERAVSTLNTAVTMVGVAATAAFAGAVTEGLRFASTLEQMQIGFETMLGSADAASTFIRSMQDFAARTPFQFEDVAHGAKRMMAMGIASEFTLPLMTAIGDRISALGGGAPEINRVITALGQMYSKGRVATQELNQLSEVGIGGFRILAAELGKTVPEVINMVEAREIDAATFLKAFMASTSAEVGGMMEKQSQTLIGLVSTLKDRVSIALGDAAQPMIEPLKAAIPEVTNFLGAVLTAATPLIAGLGQVATTVQGLLASFNALDASTQQGLLGMAGMGVAATVLAGMVASVGVAMLGVVTAIAPFASALAAVLAPEILVPILGALAAGAAVAAGAVTLFFGVFGQEGEAAGDTLSRVATTLRGVLAPAFERLGTIGGAVLDGFNARWIEMPVSMDHVAKAMLGIFDMTLKLISAITGTDFGASGWENVGKAIATVTNYLMILAVDALALVVDGITMAEAAFGPMIAAIGLVADGLFGLVTGSEDVGTATAKMGRGVVGALGAALNTVVALTLGTIATLADAGATMMDAIPGLDGSGLKGVATDMRGAMLTASSAMSSAILDGFGDFNMETDVASVAMGGFNMEVDAASNKMSSYAHSLDKMVGALSGVTKAAKAPKTPEVPKSPELPPILPGPGIEVGSDYGAVMQGLFDLAPYEQVIGMEITSLIESMRSAAFNGETNLTNDELGYFAAKIEEAQAKLDAYNEGLEKSKQVVDFYNNQLWKLADAGLGKLGSTIQDAISGAKTGGVWGALVAVLVDLLVSSETMADITATLDRSFGQISNVFGKLLGGVHVVVGNVLNVVAAFVGIFEPLFEHVAKAFAGFGAGLYTLAFIFESLSGLMQVLMAPMQMLEPLLNVAFEAFFSLMQFVGVILLGAVLGIQKAWNWILGVLADALEWIGAKDAAANLEGYMADTTATQDALSTLMNTTYEQAQAQSELVVSVDAVTESMNSMVNIPTLFKTALVAFQSADTSSKFSIPAFATGGLVSGPTVALIGEAGPEAVVPLRSKNPGALAGLMGGGGGDTIIIIESMTVQAEDPASLFEKIERYAARKQVQRKGTPLVRPGRYSTG